MAVSTIQDFGPDKVEDEPISVRRTSDVRGVCERALKFRRRWQGCTVKKAMTANRTWEIRPYGITGRPGETWIERLRALQIYPDRPVQHILTIN